jgi:hypothetical protein
VFEKSSGHPAKGPKRGVGRLICSLATILFAGVLFLSDAAAAAMKQQYLIC